eukprot:evm.model.NODE_7313_length_17182_cov_38.694389.6
MLRLLVLLLAVAAASISSAFLLPSPASPPSSRIPAPLPAFPAPWSSPSTATGIKTPRSLVQKEDSLLEAIQGLDRREIQNSAEARARVKSLIDDLEASKGIRKATATKEINGKWRLLYTSSDGTASPIQNTFVRSKAFAIYQEIDIAPPSSSSSSPSSPATVTNVVDFGGSIGALNVQALASTPFRPIPGFEPRKGDGKLFGINVLGVSKTEVPRDGDPADRMVGGHVSLTAAEVVTGQQGHDIRTAEGGVRTAQVYVKGGN